MKSVPLALLLGLPGFAVSDDELSGIPSIVDGDTIDLQALGSECMVSMPQTLGKCARQL